MPYFIPKEPVRVCLPDNEEEWIAIKPALNWEDRAYIQSRICQTGLEVQPGTAQSEVDGMPIRIEMHMEQAVPALLEKAVVGWRLLDEDGTEVPFSRTLAKDADPENLLWDLVIQELLARNPTLLDSKVRQRGPKT